VLNKSSKLVAIIDDELDITVLFRDAIRGIRGISNLIDVSHLADGVRLNT
jgi:hypothetical protein